MRYYNVFLLLISRINRNWQADISIFRRGDELALSNFAGTSPSSRWLFAPFAIYWLPLTYSQSSQWYGRNVCEDWLRTTYNQSVQHGAKARRVDGEIAARLTSASSPSSNSSRRETSIVRLLISNHVDEDWNEFVMRARLVKNANLWSFCSRSLFERLVQLVQSACAVGRGDMMWKILRVKCSNIGRDPFLLLTWIFISHTLPHRIESCNPLWGLAVEQFGTFQGSLTSLEIVCWGQLKRTWLSSENKHSKMERRRHFHMTRTRLRLYAYH